LQTIVTSRRGGAHLNRAKVAKAVTLRVTGGTSALGTRNDATLYGRIDIDPQRIRVQHVTPVTTLALRVAKDRRTTYAAGMRAVRNYLEIPQWTREWQHSLATRLFDAQRFTAYIARNGGVKKSLGSLEREILKGRPPRSFGSDAPAPRSTYSAAGEFLFDAVVEAATGDSPDEIIGELFGTTNPTEQALDNIESQLTQITNMLVTIEADMQDMLTQIAITQYDTIAQSLSTAVDNTENQWVNYNYVVNNVNPNNRATYQDYAEGFYQDINPTIAQFNSLFTTPGSTGLLDELYQMNATEYPWWTAGDITNMQSTVDYYGTMQAEAVTLLSEAWNFSSSTYEYTMTPAYIDGQINGLYTTQIDNIYASLPDSLNTGEIVNPANRRAYMLTPVAQPNTVYEQVVGYGACNTITYSDAYSYTTPPITSADGFANLWASETPSSYTSAASSEMAFLGTQRTTSSNGTTSSTNALPAMMVNAPDAWLMVSNEALPLLYLLYEPPIDPPPYYGWAYCNGAAVSLVPSQIQAFAQNFVLQQGNSYVPAGQQLSASSSIPVALLVSRTGQFAYVPPVE
jgi:hypothetical protein